MVSGNVQRREEMDKFHLNCSHRESEKKEPFAYLAVVNLKGIILKWILNKL